MSDQTETKAEGEAPRETPWIALAPLRWGNNDDGSPRWLKPGDPVPLEDGRSYELMRRTGQIGFKDGAAAPAVAPVVAFRLHDEYLPRAQAPVEGEGAGEPAQAGNGGEGDAGTGGEGGGEAPAAGSEPAPIPLSEDMTLAELGAIAESYGLPTSGSKAQIITRVEKRRVELAASKPSEGGGA